MANIDQAYEGLNKAMESDTSQIIQKDNAIFQLSTIEFQKKVICHLYHHLIWENVKR